VYEQVPTRHLPNLKIYVFAAEGVASSKTPQISQMCQKVSPKASKGHPNGAPRPQKTLQSTTQKREEKRLPKRHKNKPVLAREREARLKEESLPNIVSTAV